MRLMISAASLSALVAVGPAGAASPEVLRELAPTGALRAGLAFAPALTPVFVTRDAAGEGHGVARDLAEAMANKLGVPVTFTLAATTGALAEACAKGEIDIAFMPADDERRQRLDFSPPYFIIENTYLVAGTSDIQTVNDVDRSTVTIVGIAGSTTIRAVGRQIQKARIVPAPTIDAAMQMLIDGTAQAFALTHDALPALQRRLPGSRILDGAFQRTDVAISLGKGRPAALAFVRDFIERTKADGSLRRDFEAAGLGTLTPAPAE
jgi:polar amino acid transport system substrate-binding protein